MIKRILLSFLLLGCVLPMLAQRPKIGLVLGGGGAKGATQVGVLKEIERAGIPIDYIAGTSIGSIVGGLYSVGYRADDLDTLFRSQNWLALLTDRDTTLVGRVLKEEDGVYYLFGFPVRRKKGASVPRKGFGLLHGDRIYNFLDSLVANAPVNSGKAAGRKRIPFQCVAFDIKRRKQVVLGADSLARNMRASMAIPGGFKPVRMDSMVLVDGGMINNLPVDIVRGMGADIVIAIDLTQNKHDDYKSPFAFLKNLGGVLQWLAERPDIRKYNENRRNADIYINPDLGDYGVTSFKPDAIADMIDIGCRAGEEKYDELMRLKERLKTRRSSE